MIFLNNNKPEDNEALSLPETVARIRETRKRLNLTPTQVWEMVKNVQNGPAETTVRRIIDDNEPLNTKWHRDYVEIIADALWGSSAIKFDPKKARQYFEESNALRVSSEETARQLAETKGQLELYRKLYECVFSDKEWLKERVEFLETRVEYNSAEKPEKAEP